MDFMSKNINIKLNKSPQSKMWHIRYIYLLWTGGGEWERGQQVHTRVSSYIGTKLLFYTW